MKHFLSLLLLSLPVSAWAATEPYGTLGDTVWKSDTIPVITGVHLKGDTEDERRLCFVPDADTDDFLCFQPNSSAIREWSDARIQFVPASNTPPSGLVKLLLTLHEESCSQGTCTTVEHQRDIEIGSYRAHPVITSVVEVSTGLSSPSLIVGKRYEIRGYRFGDGKNSVYLGRKQLNSSDIESWAYNAIVFTVPSGAPEDATLQVHNGVAKSNPFTARAAEEVSNDPLSSLQSHLLQSKVVPAWQHTKGKGRIIAVLDSGIDTNHEEFAGRFWRNVKETRGNGKDDDKNGFVDDVNGWNFVNDSAELTPTTSHGTEVAGIIAANAGNGVGVAGIAPDATIMSLIVADSEGRVKELHVREAIRYAVDHGAHIINLSIGGPGFTDDFSPSYTETIRYAVERNVLVVIAAGNGDAVGQEIGRSQGVNLNQNPKSPVCNREEPRWTLGVAAIGSNDRRSTFSDYGSNCIDIAALGENVVTTTFHAFSPKGERYLGVSGTSVATPIVSGIAALAWATNPQLAAWQVRDILVQTSSPLRDDGIGGLVQADTALELAQKTTPRAPLFQGGAEGQTSSMPRTRSGIFSDVPTNHPYVDAIVWAKEQGILSGYPDGSFQPERTVNRAELLKILLTAAGEKSSAGRVGFRDVDESAWYAPFIRIGQRLGIVQGYEDGTFRPTQAVNIAEALKMAYAALQVPTADARGEWYQRYLTHATKHRILFARRVNPSAPMKRKDVVWVVWRLMGE